MRIPTIINVLGLVAVLALEPLSPRQVSAQPGISVPIQTFYNELAPYGQWVPSPMYGSVWVPNVGQDFQPYATDGHWVVTEFGNTWVSDYPWGWAPFHYGRWYFDNQFGWAWVPGNDWGPAWVSWRSGGGYYGWAPLGPGLDINVNINIPAPYWTFVPQVYITSPYLYSYRVARPNVVNIYQNTTIINNIYRSNDRAYVYGPNRREIERITRSNVPVYRIDPLDRPGRSVIGNGSVGFYRPGGQSVYGQNYDRNDRFDRYDRNDRYNRNDRFDNSPRPNYNNNAPGRGTYGSNNPYNGNSNPGRDYNGNNGVNRPDYNSGNNAPGRAYNGSPGRGGYNENFTNTPIDRNGAVSAPAPNPGNAAPTPSNRFEPSRGSFQPGGSRGEAQPGGFQQQPNRTFERAERPGSMDNAGSRGFQNAPSAPGARSDGGNFQRMPDSRGGQPQPGAQEQLQRGNGEGGRQRGPR